MIDLIAQVRNDGGDGLGRGIRIRPDPIAFPKQRLCYFLLSLF